MCFLIGTDENRLQLEQRADCCCMELQIWVKRYKRGIPELLQADITEKLLSFLTVRPLTTATFQMLCHEYPYSSSPIGTADIIEDSRKMTMLDLAIFCNQLELRKVCMEMGVNPSFFPKEPVDGFYEIVTAKRLGWHLEDALTQNIGHEFLMRYAYGTGSKLLVRGFRKLGVPRLSYGASFLTAKLFCTAQKGSKL